MESSFIVIMGKVVIPVNIGNNLPYNIRALATMRSVPTSLGLIVAVGGILIFHRYSRLVCSLSHEKSAPDKFLY